MPQNSFTFGDCFRLRYNPCNLKVFYHDQFNPTFPLWILYLIAFGFTVQSIIPGMICWS